MPPARPVSVLCTTLVLCAATSAPARLTAQMTAAPRERAPEADSAAEARQAYRRAVAAYRARDLATARREMNAAATWWPGQQAYLAAAASLAAEVHDTSSAARWIERLAVLGVGGETTRDSAFHVLRGAPAYDSAAARLQRATAPLPRGRVRFTVADSTLHPEGLAYDERTGRWFVGSVRQRRVLAVDRAGVTRDFVEPAAGGIGGVFGMAVDSARRVLWVATTALPRMQGFAPLDSGRAGVYGYDLGTGLLRRHAWISRDSSDHTVGDVVVAPSGDVYLTDSQAPWILRLRAADDSLERFVTHPLFRSLQGMAITPDGRVMFVADYSHGLLRVDLATRAVEAVAHPAEVTLLGIDGLYLHRRTLVGIQNGVTPARVVRLCLDAAMRRVWRADVIDRQPELADEPTLGTVVGDSLFYVGTSQWEKFDATGRRVTGTRLRDATVVGVDLTRAPVCR